MNKLRYKNKIVVALLFLMNAMVGMSQTNVTSRFVQEKVVLTTDRTLYFAGEQILLKVNCILPESKDSLSRVAYVELLDKRSKPILQKKLLVVSGAASTVISIPEEVITGNYYLRGYTQYMRNFDANTLYTTELTVINPELPAKEAIQTVIDSTRSFNKGKEIVTVSTADSSFLPNSLITLELKGKDNTNVSVSVVKKGSYDPLTVGIQNYFQSGASVKSVNKLNWYPEIRAVSISGKVLDKSNGQPLRNIFVYASTIDSAKQFHVVRTNEDGLFIFSLTNLHENHVVYICAEFDATILVNADFAEKLPPVNYRTVKMDSAKRVLMNEMYENAQVSDIYREERVPSKTYADTVPDPFKSTTEKLFLKDYVPLPLFSDYFKEIIPYTRIKSRKEGPQIQLVDRRSKEFFEHPLILIDNIPFHDHGALLSIPPSKINSVDVIASKYVFGKEILNGVVIVKTKEGNLGGLPLPNDVVSVDYITYDPMMSLPPEKENNYTISKPGLKNTLYWNEEVMLKDGHQTIQFYSSNYLSDYDVVIRGVDEEGEEFTQIKTITISNK
ncbi:MAG TPA: hypothetical protein VFF27_08915 [Bacteroidia bacterium]|jgi:hypothetical protein|nr:hypothetical protein [Bacteroidia bacterium]